MPFSLETGLVRNVKEDTNRTDALPNVKDERYYLLCEGLQIDNEELYLFESDELQRLDSAIFSGNRLATYTGKCLRLESRGQNVGMDGCTARR